MKFCAMVLLTGSLSLGLLLSSCGSPPAYDLIIRNGVLYDGTGSSPVKGDLAINGDRIVAVGQVEGQGREEYDVQGMAVAPGFINMLSWATESLLIDGTAESDIRQGVTLEVFGEGSSMGPLNQAMKEEMRRSQGDFQFEIAWTTLSEYLEYLEDKGVAPNVASFVGATTVRVHELGHEDRPPTPEELDRMKDLVREAMEEGALGVGSSLIYAPAFYADTEELIALSQVAADYGGMYISHIRSEGNRLVEAVDELIRIAREGNLAAEIYHLKAAGRSNWDKLGEVVERVEAARSQGLKITADMYTYTAGATGLDAAMPPWIQEGGHQQWVKRLKDPDVRRQLAREMTTPTDDWENLFLAAGDPDNILLVGFNNPDLKHLTGKTLGQVARDRGKSPEETAMDLVIEDDSRVGTVYFLMSEDNVKKKVALPWVSFGSDAAAPAAEGVFLKRNPHPRAYGNFARLLGKYVREERVIPLEVAIHRLTGFAAANLRIKERGLLKEDYFADIVVFDPERIQDHATFEEPHQYATGVVHVFVNGEQVLKEGEPTGALPGRVVRGPGYRGKD